MNYNNLFHQTILLCVLFFLLISILFIVNKNSDLNAKNKLFYSINEIEPLLNDIDNIKENILSETINANNNCNMWKEWPEKKLYSKSDLDGWKVFPFYAFGIWVKENCSKCPIIYNFLKKIPGLKLATLSKLKGGTKLNLHQGWASHSNFVIRCHYGLIVPDNSCYIYVQDDETGKDGIKYHHKFEWLIFDDSKSHYAENYSNADRIVLILDIKRPNNLETGKSDIGDSNELLEIIDYFRKKNYL